MYSKTGILYIHVIRGIEEQDGRFGAMIIRGLLRQVFAMAGLTVC